MLELSLRAWVWLRRGCVALALGVVLALHVGAGLRGVGFGSMWDEGYQLEGLRRSVDELRLLPGGYYYGGLYYAPGYCLIASAFTSRLPAMLREMSDAPSRPFNPALYPSIVAAQESARAALDAPDFLERERRLFVVIGALAIVWVFAAAWLSTGSAGAALAAAAALGFSWEFSYHGRWVASDVVLAQFAALVLACVIGALGAGTAARERRWLRVAAAAAGLGLGAKLPGLFLLVPVFAAVAWSLHTRGLRARCLRLLELAAIALGCFVVTTPGVVLDPLHFAADLFRVRSDYNRIADSYAYAEPALGSRLGKIGAYLGAVALSPHVVAALVLTGFCLVGAGSAVVRRRPKLLAVLAFVVVYTAVIAMQRLFIVRNLMATLPALAILAGAGVQQTLRQAARFRGARIAITSVLLGIAGANASWLVRSAKTVGTTNSGSVAEAVARHLEQRPGTRFYVEPAVLDALARVLPEGQTLRTTALEQADEIVVFADSLESWRANTPRFARYFATDFVNYDHYPTCLGWPGLRDRVRPIVVMPASRLEREAKLLRR